MEFTKQIADTIIKQMGGASVLRIMVGASDFSYGTIDYKGFVQSYGMFKFKMNTKLKYVRVIYDEGKDTYVMQFLGRTFKVHKEFEDVYCDELVRIFEETTGLYLKLWDK